MRNSISSPVMFRVVAIYQYMENYGAHDWDGVGECPQYWKYKGGAEEVIVNGLTTLEAAIAALKDPFFLATAAREEYSSEYAINQLLCLAFDYSGAPTEEEAMDAYYELGIDLEAKTYKYLTEDDFAIQPLDRYDAMAEAHGYL